MERGREEAWREIEKRYGNREEMGRRKMEGERVVRQKLNGYQIY